MNKLERPVNHAIDSFEQWGKIDPALLNCMPDFFVIAPPRSGSTWVFENLRRHPEVFIPHLKEVKYFSNYWNMCDINWYLGCFKDGSDKRKGEVSPSYSILPDQIINEIKNIVPNLRIIFVFRDPIERIWSHVKHQFRLKESVFAFTNDAYKNIPEEKFIESLTNTGTIVYSDYLSIVRRWMALYPKEDIHISFFDSIVNSPRPLLEEFFQHIGVSKDVDWSLFPLHKRVNPGIEQEVPIKIKEFLLSFYSKKIKEFADFLLDNFDLNIPESWEYIADMDKSNKEIEPYKLYFSDDNNQIILKDILLRESIQSTHVQLLKDDYKGFKIIAFRGECLAISRVLDGIDIIQMSKTDLERLKREGKIFCCETLNESISLIDTKAYDAIKRENEALQRNLNVMQGEMAARDARTEALQGEITSKDGIIQKQDKELEAKESRIIELQNNIADRDARIEALQGELNNIKALLWFRLYKFILRR